jgi:hypothetical protein
VADDIRKIQVLIGASVDGDDFIEAHGTAEIPPDYDSADIRALMVRKIEDTAFELTQREFGRQPTRTALRAAVARLIGIELSLRQPGNRQQIIDRVQQLIDLSNDDAIEQFGEAVEED